MAISLTFEPDAPAVSRRSRAIVTLRDDAGRPVRGARLQLQAQMSHPGMAPVLATLAESGDGTYTAAVDFSMGGDWLVTTEGTLADGRTFGQTLQVAVTGAPSTP